MAVRRSTSTTTSILNAVVPRQSLDLSVPSKASSMLCIVGSLRGVYLLEFKVPES